MISKDTIISLAWLKIGEQNQLYNVNMTERQKIADMLLANIFKNVATDTTFLFNAKTVRLNQNLEGKNFRGENRFNRPVDFLSKVWTSDRTARVENEFIYSKDEELDMMYCAQISVTEFPDYLEPYLIARLAVSLCEAYDTFRDKLQYVHQQMIEERNKLVVNEGAPFQIKR